MHLGEALSQNSASGGHPIRGRHADPVAHPSVHTSAETCTQCEASHPPAGDEASPSDWRAVERTTKGRQESGERPAAGALWDGALGDPAGSGGAGRWECPALQGSAGFLTELQWNDNSYSSRVTGKSLPRQRLPGAGPPCCQPPPPLSKQPALSLPQDPVLQLFTD